MNIEVRKQVKKSKYYLAHSFREGKKVKKIRRFLGVDLSKKDLEILKKRAEEIIKQQLESYGFIKNALKEELSAKELSFLKNLESKYPVKKIKFSEDKWRLFSELFTYDTNAIEGSLASKKDVRDILEKDEWPAYLSLRDIAETHGVNVAIEFIKKTKEQLSLNLIKKLHKIIFKNSKDFAGKFRKIGQEVVVQGSMRNIVHVGAPSTRVRGLLEELVDWYEKNKKKYPTLILAAVVHNQFETIHPFADGNGRVGRLLLNNILIKNKLPPVNIQLKNRLAYYSALQEYQKKGNLRPMIELILKEYKNFENIK